MTEKQRTQMFRNIWCCAFQRALQHQNTSRYFREKQTIDMCLSAAKWEKFCAS
jgi:hypothetical protein